jgi:hypothetical protein
MAAKESKKPGLLAKRLERRRLKRERTGDTRDKKGERPESGYDATDVADRIARGAATGASNWKHHTRERLSRGPGVLADTPWPSRRQSLGTWTRGLCRGVPLA